ncbi:MAG: helix-turn-helix domain-containing protein [Nitrospirae bacterium]|nr:helix-turn-helix domain-containing protein [Magnetococcales bacterium]
MIDRMKRVRSYLGVTQKIMSDKLGLGVSTWQQYELGKSLPGTETLQKLAKLGFDVHWILTGEGSMLRNSDHAFKEDPPTPDILTPDMIFQMSLALENFLAEEKLAKAIRPEERATLLKILCNIGRGTY